MESLLDYVEHPDVTRQGFEAVMVALSHILETGKGAGHIFLEWGGKETLIKIMKNQENYTDDVLISAMTCIHNISLHWALRHFVADQEIIAGIIGVLAKNNNTQVCLF